MTDINDQASDTSSELNWPIEHSIEGQHNDRVIFENVADQYVKGSDVTAFFTIVQDIKVNASEDQIGLLRVGCTNIKDCVAYAVAQFAPSTASGSGRHGTAVFPAASLPVTDDEFYQFCYILNRTKNLGSSIPFQLNCAPDDIDLLTNTPVNKTKADGLIALADNDNDDFLVIHSKRGLTEEKIRQENRRLLEINRRLELQKEEYQLELEHIHSKQTEQIAKLNQEMQTLINIHKTSLVELSAYQHDEAKLRTELAETRKLCEQHRNEAEQNADHCRTLEVAQEHIQCDTNQIRSQLAVTSQLAKDQATQIIDLQRRLIQADELTKAADQRVSTLEQQMRDLRLVSEKYQLSSQGQIQEYARKISQLEDQIKALEQTKTLLQEELSSVNKGQNDQMKEWQQQYQQMQMENDELKSELEKLRMAANDKNVDQQGHLALKNSFKEIEKRCVKHQKQELEAKKQLAVFQNYINDLQRENEELNDRLASGTEEYKGLFRKFALLERSSNHGQIQPQVERAASVDKEEEQLVEMLCNSATVDQQSRDSFMRASMANVDSEVVQCPMCYWQFPQHMNTEGKREHIEEHFQ